MAEQLNVKTRENFGKRNNRRLRRGGGIPAILYGHGEANVSLSLSREELEAAIRRGSKMVQLEGDVSETALIRQLQWDAFGIEVLHVDLGRVSATEKVETTVPVELRGEAPGAKSGGLVEHLIHSVLLECPAASIPDKLTVNINSLQLDESLKISAIELPEGARLLVDADALVVQCVAPAVVAEEEEAAETAEPEVIGRKAEDEEEEEKKS